MWFYHMHGISSTYKIRLVTLYSLSISSSHLHNLHEVLMM